MPSRCFQTSFFFLLFIYVSINTLLEIITMKVILVLSLLLSGCANQQYATRYEYSQTHEQIRSFGETAGDIATVVYMFQQLR